MKLKDLFTKFTSLSEREQLDFVLKYRDRRQTDLNTLEIKVKEKNSKPTKVKLTPEQKALLSSIGIKIKDIAALKKG